MTLDTTASDAETLRTALANVKTAADGVILTTSDRDRWIRIASKAGASLRTIAAASGLSHGTIAKIVAGKDNDAA